MINKDTNIFPVDLELIQTADGSFSLYRKDIEETYHSRHGARQESMHVFIKMGLLPALSARSELHLFEVGFGTGLNALLTFLEVSRIGATVYYHALEPFPIDQKLIEDWSALLPDQEKDLLLKMHQLDWGKWEEVSSGFFLFKEKCSLQEVKLDNQSKHLIYFDAFGPRAQEDMWKLELFEKLAHAMAHQGIFVTYCAKGQVRRDLEAVGLTTERLAGPPGKREMLRAQKTTTE
jgi:tRNA U34 5-methylaminomethyl-2-thiouridine-forming methyltransferase MnmC